MQAPLGQPTLAAFVGQRARNFVWFLVASAGWKVDAGVLGLLKLPQPTGSPGLWDEALRWLEEHDAEQKAAVDDLVPKLGAQVWSQVIVPQAADAAAFERLYRDTLLPVLAAVASPGVRPRVASLATQAAWHGESHDRWAEANAGLIEIGLKQASALQPTNGVAAVAGRRMVLFLTTMAGVAAKAPLISDVHVPIHSDADETAANVMARYTVLFFDLALGALPTPPQQQAAEAPAPRPQPQPAGPDARELQTLAEAAAPAPPEQRAPAGIPREAAPQPMEDDFAEMAALARGGGAQQQQQQAPPPTPHLNSFGAGLPEGIDDGNDDPDDPGLKFLRRRGQQQHQRRREGGGGRGHSEYAGLSRGDPDATGETDKNRFLEWDMAAASGDGNAAEMMDVKRQLDDAQKRRYHGMDPVSYALYIKSMNFQEQMNSINPALTLANQNGEQGEAETRYQASAARRMQQDRPDSILGAFVRLFTGRSQTPPEAPDPERPAAATQPAGLLPPDWTGARIPLPAFVPAGTVATGAIKETRKQWLQSDWAMG